MKELEQDLNSLPQKALVASAFVTYLSGEPEDVRSAVTSIWEQIVYGPDGQRSGESFNFKRFLSSEPEQLVWKATGLPSDNLSLENAIVILQVSNLEVVLNINFVFNCDQMFCKLGITCLL